MCKRSTDDPLVRAFLDDYGLNLLRVPREGVECGDLYVRVNGALTAPGAARELLEPALELPPVTRGERLADISGTLSNGFQLDVGLGLLDGFFAALGAGGVINETRAGYRRSRGTTLRFRFGEATRDSVDPLALGSALSGKRFKGDHPFVTRGSEYFVVGAVVRTPAISIALEGSRSRALDLEAGVLAVVNGQSAVSAIREREGEVTYRGAPPLAIGIETYEVRYDERQGRLNMRPSTRALPFKAQEQAPRPAFLGADEEALVEISG